MVSNKTKLLIGAGLALVVIALSLKPKGSGSNVLPPSDMVTPPIESGELQGLQKILGQAQALLKNTFKAPILRQGLTTGGKTAPCRGPNCLGIFAAKGTRSAFNPFTGQRIALAGSTEFQNITGANFEQNQFLIDQGVQTGTDLRSFISSLESQINTLTTTNNV